METLLFILLVVASILLLWAICMIIREVSRISKLNQMLNAAIYYDSLGAKYKSDLTAEQLNELAASRWN